MRKLIPKFLLDWYHLFFALGGAAWYGFPSRKLIVIAVTGTKGKSTVCELLRAILTEQGHTVALASTIRFAVGGESERNLFKMTMPGRAYLQQFLRRAVNAGATHAVIEMTSEGAVQYRHRGIELDALVFTNLQPEHLERHGGMEAYAQAKLSLAAHLAASRKRPRYIVANADDAYGLRFLEAPVEVRVPFSLKDAEPYSVDDRGVRFVYKGGELMTAPLPGVFNLYNILAALALTEAMGVPRATAARALAHIPPVSGRAERVERGQPFAAVIDYAHTPDSLRALLDTYAGKKIICVMGSTGGGRDAWERPAMGTLADERCTAVILTNEDPYDEDPRNIVEAIATGFSHLKPDIILDRRAAIAHALALAKAGAGEAVLVVGKGTDPYIMEARGKKTPWSDAQVVAEELQKLGYY